MQVSQHYGSLAFYASADNAQEQQADGFTAHHVQRHSCCWLGEASQGEVIWVL